MQKRCFRFTVFMLMLVALAVMTACSMPDKIDDIQEDRGLGFAMVSIDYDKTLSPFTNNRIKYWEFMATPLFSLEADEGVIVGRVDYWRQLPALTTPENGKLLSEATLGKYMAGNWLFELRALNANGHVVAVGSTRIIIREGLDNIIPITVYQDSADGTHGESADEGSRRTGVTDKALGKETTVRYADLHMGFLMNQLEASLDDMRIRTYIQKFERITNKISEPEEVDFDWTVVEDGKSIPEWSMRKGNVPAGKAWFETTKKFDAGVYLVTVKFDVLNRDGNWVELGGQGFNVVMIGGEETAVRGYLTAGSYVVCGIKIAVPGSIFGSINGTGSVVSVNGEAVSLAWFQDDDEKANSEEDTVSFDWYFNGEKQNSHEESIIFNCPVGDDGKPIYGVYRVSLCPWGSAGSRGHSDIDVIFNPIEQGQLDDYDWDAERTHEVIVRDIYDIDPGVVGDEIVIGYVPGDGTPVRWEDLDDGNMLEYPFKGRTKYLKDMQTATDLALSPVYVTNAAGIEAARATTVWMGPNATLGDTTTMRCPTLRSVRYVPNATTVNAFSAKMVSGLEEVIIHEGITDIYAQAFAGSPKLTVVHVPDATLGQGVFMNCTELQKVRFSGNANINDAFSLFEGCTALREAILPKNGSSTIPERAFYGTTALEKIGIPSSISALDISAFEGSGLYSVNSSSVRSISTNTFGRCPNLQEVTLNGMTAMGDGAFKDSKMLTAVHANNLQMMGESVFSGCTALEDFVVKGTVNNIGKNAFYGCTDLKTVTISEGVKTIGEQAFYGCSSLNSVLVADTVTTIGPKAFYGCSKVEHARIGKNVNLIGANAFGNCTGLEEVKFINKNGWNAGGKAITAESLADIRAAVALVNKTYVGSEWTRK